MSTAPADEPRPTLNAADERTKQLVVDARSFVRQQRWPIAIAAVAAILTHGVALANSSLSLDEPLHVVHPGVTGINIGRPTMGLIKTVTQDVMPLPLWNTALGLALLLVAGVGFAFLLLRAARPAGDHRIAVTVFLVFFMTFPLTAYWLMWGEAAIAYAFGILLAALAAIFGWLWVAEGWSRTAAFASAATAFFVVTTYQSQLFVALAGVLAANLAYELRPESRGRAIGPKLRTSIKLVLPILAGGLLGALITARLVFNGSQETAYHANFLAWGKEDPVAIVGELTTQVVDYASGDGFFGGWVLIPTLVVAGALAVYIVWQALRGAGWWPIVLLAGLLLVPFGASVMLGTALLPRSIQAIPLVVGAVWVLWALTFPRTTARNAILIGATLLLTVWHSNITSHLYFVELTTYQVDRSIASAIVERLAARGWDGEPVPLLTIGARQPTVIEDMENADAFGYPLFNELGLGGRSIPFMEAVGHTFVFPTLDDWERARAIAEGMPDWPADGSVVLQDGLAVVRFAQPTVG